MEGLRTRINALSKTIFISDQATEPNKANKNYVAKIFAHHY